MIELTTLVSESGGRWIDGKGRSLVNMGHAPLYQGKQVWTDGVVIYGYPLLGTTFTDPPKKKKENKAGIVYFVQISNDLTDLTADINYYKPHGTQVNETIDLLRKSQDWELMTVELDEFFAGNNVVFWGCDTIDDVNHYFIADALGGSAYVPVTELRPLRVSPNLWDLDLNGNSAWFVGSISSTYYDEDLRGFLFYADRGCSNTSYLQLGLIRQEIQNALYNELPHTSEADGNIRRSKWVGYYDHSEYGFYCANGYIKNGEFNCDMCVEFTGWILYTPENDDPYTEDFDYFYDIHIVGTNYTYVLHEGYSTVAVGDCGTYDGEQQTMTVTYEANNTRYTNVLHDIPVNTRVQQIGNAVYVFNPGINGDSNYFMYICHDGIVDELTEPYSRVNATRLEYKTDVTAYGRAWCPQT